MKPENKETFLEWVTRKGLTGIFSPAKLKKVTGKCLVCNFPLKLTTGQIAYYHKGCRFARNSYFDRETMARKMHKEHSKSTMVASDTVSK